MAIESNIVYLEEELKNNREKLALMEKYLNENPAISVYKRMIGKRAYYYRKLRKNGKSISEFLSKGDLGAQEKVNAILNAQEKRHRVKAQVQELKASISALAKQLKIVRRVYRRD